MNFLTKLLLAFALLPLTQSMLFGQVSLGSNIGVYAQYLKNEVEFSPSFGAGVDLNYQKNKWMFGLGLTKITDTQATDAWAEFEFDGGDAQVGENTTLLENSIFFHLNAFYNFYSLWDKVHLSGGTQIAFLNYKTSGEVTRTEAFWATGEERIALHDEDLREAIFRILGRADISIKKVAIFGEIGVPIISKYSVLLNANLGIRFFLSSSRDQ